MCECGEEKDTKRDIHNTQIHETNNFPFCFRNQIDKNGINQTKNNFKLKKKKNKINRTLKDYGRKL